MPTRQAAINEIIALFDISAQNDKRNCDGCKLFASMGVHSFTCPIREEKIEISVSAPLIENESYPGIQRIYDGDKGTNAQYAPLETEGWYKERYQNMFDDLSELGTAHPNLPTHFYEALDFVANFCGDKAFDREVTMDAPEVAFESVITHTTKQNTRKVREEVLRDIIEAAEPYDGAKWLNNLSPKQLEKIILSEHPVEKKI